MHVDPEKMFFVIKTQEADTMENEDSFEREEEKTREQRAQEYILWGAGRAAAIALVPLLYRPPLISGLN